MRIAVLGAGLAGLATSRRLAALAPDAQITLLEAAPRAGGWVHTHRRRIAVPGADGADADVEGEVVLESGPRTIRPRGGEGARRMLGLIDDLGLRDDILAVPKSHPAAKNRFILDPTDGTLHTPPFLRSRALRRIPLDLLAEPFRRARRRGPVHGSGLTADDDESVADFVARRLPAAVPLVSAFTHGIYAAAPAKLSLRACFPALYEAERDHGSVVWGMLRRSASKGEGWEALGELGKEREDWSIYGIRGGTDTLTEVMLRDVRQRGVDVRIGTGATGLRRVDRGVEVNTPAGPLSVDHVVAALPPPALAGLVPFPQLTSNPSTSVGVVNLVFACPPSTVHPAGFGYLVPRLVGASNPAGILGVIFDSTALPGAEGALEGRITRLTVMLGGPYWTTYAGPGGAPLPVPELEALPALALAHVRQTLPALARHDLLLAVPHLSTGCIPTYAPGHGARMRALHARLADEWAGTLSVAGSGYGGVSVNDCVGSGERVAEALVAARHGDAGAARTPVTGLERWAEWQ